MVQKAYDRANKLGKPLWNAAIIEPCAFATFSALFGTQSVVQARSAGFSFFCCC